MKATITFTKCIQDSQDYGSDDEHMASRVFFDLEMDGQTHPGLHVDVKQVVGSSYETGDIEVGRPAGFREPKCSRSTIRLEVGEGVRTGLVQPGT